MRICTLFFASDWLTLFLPSDFSTHQLRKHLSALLWIQTRNLVESTSSIFQKLHIYCCIRYFRLAKQNIKYIKHQHTTNQQTTNQTNTHKHTKHPPQQFTRIFLHRWKVCSLTWCLGQRFGNWIFGSKNRGFFVFFFGGDKLIPPLMTESLWWGPINPYGFGLMSLTVYPLKNMEIMRVDRPWHIWGLVGVGGEKQRETILSQPITRFG